MPSIDTRPPAIALMGPTASGKTALALDWAERFAGEIVSVDSALVYRGLDIGSAKPSKDELARARHHLLDLRDPHQPYSAAEFCVDALAAMDDINARARMPILVGGTGLYFRALFDGLSPMPEADPAIRAELAAEAEVSGWPAMHAQLAVVDPQAATRVHASDPQRIQRALEVFRLTGKPISAWQNDARCPPRMPFRFLKIALWPDRNLLRERIARRFDAMLSAGFLDEVRRLRADPRLHADLPAMRAVGYRQAWEHLDGLSSTDAFRQLVIHATTQLAKRQRTLLRGESDVFRIDPGSKVDHGRLARLLRDFLPTS
ncbi:MAG: tRNA (adenosine(37)-N6)-dimethylallyltransferase MiaA [Pseudomarimonas sp.]